MIPSEIHVNIAPWRYKGMNSKFPIRYPVSIKHKQYCLYSLAENKDSTISNIPLNYIQARKQIYLPLYSKLVKDRPQFHKFSYYRNGWST